MQSPVADREYEDPKPVHVILHSGDRELKKESPDDTAAASGGVDGTGGSDAGAIELARRPRGRPRGSRNKPKPPIIIEAESPSAMRAHILEIPAGHDIADCLARFSRRKNLGLCVLAGTGAVANVTLRQPGEAGATFSYLGRFEILSITATLMPPQLAAAAAAPGLCITLAGPQGRVVGGAVVGPLLAAGKVVMVAAAFVEPSFHRLPVEEDVSVTVSGEQAREAEHEYDDPLLRHQQQLGAAGTPESCAMSVYSCQLPSEVIWAPAAARPPAPSPY